MPEPALAQEQLTATASPALRIVEPAAPDQPSAPPSQRSAPPDRPHPRLEVPAYDLQAALTLEQELGVSHVLAQVLVRRGLADTAAAREFLQAEEQHPPSAFRGIDRAIAAIERHIAAGTTITVHGDYDVDGVCATAILVRSLRSLGANGRSMPAASRW